MFRVHESRRNRDSVFTRDDVMWQTVP